MLRATSPHATTPAHLARATFEAIACQIADVFDAMEADIGMPLTALQADGGASANDFLMQLQADILQRPALQSPVEDVGAIGAAGMALTHFGRSKTLKPAQLRKFRPADHPASAQRIWAKAIAAARA
jgi:glycerol kinase